MPLCEDDSLDIVFESSRGSGDRRQVSMDDLSEGSSLDMNQPVSRSTAAAAESKKQSSVKIKAFQEYEIHVYYFFYFGDKYRKMYNVYF